MGSPLFKEGAFAEQNAGSRMRIGVFCSEGEKNPLDRWLRYAKPGRGEGRDLNFGINVPRI
jgi:hypothetical protein